MSESGRCLSILARKLQSCPKKMETTPHTTTYTSHDIQNVIIELMSILATEHIVEEVGNVFYSIKVD